MPVITISGCLGSNARDIGRRIAETLKLDYVDKQILTEAAGALGVTEESVEERDERTPHFGERLAALLRNVLERSATAGAADPMLGPGGLEMLMATTYGEAAALPPQGADISDARYKDAITDIITGLADKGSVVIIGRGSQAILKDRPDCLHVYLTAPAAVRVPRIVEREGISTDRAKHRIHESDRDRGEFHRKFFKVEPADPDLYDLTLNTGRLSDDDVAALLVDAYRRKFGK